jgi:hypothetical protein
VGSPTVQTGARPNDVPPVNPPPKSWSGIESGGPLGEQSLGAGAKDGTTGGSVDSAGEAGVEARIGDAPLEGVGTERSGAPGADAVGPETVGAQPAASSTGTSASQLPRFWDRCRSARSIAGLPLSTTLLISPLRALMRPA